MGGDLTLVEVVLSFKMFVWLFLAALGFLTWFCAIGWINTKKEAAVHTIRRDIYRINNMSR